MPALKEANEKGDTLQNLMKGHPDLQDQLPGHLRVFVS